MAHPIGIDLGTTYSAIAKWEVKPAFIAPYVYNHPTENNSGGSYTLASKVFFPNAESINSPVVGRPAIQKGIIKPNLYFKAFKRGMDDNAVIEREGGFKITPVELSSIVLEKLLTTAEAEEGPNSWVPDGIVVSVPAYFNEKQNLNTVQAIKSAVKKLFEGRKGYNENIFLRLIPEPVAAGLDYVFEHPNDIRHEKIVIFDLGGGTFDITIFEVTNDLEKREIVFKTLATDGDDRLGGEDFDNTLRTYIIEDEGYEESKLSNNGKSLLAERCTELKCALTISDTEEIIVPYIVDQENLEKVVSRKEFEQCMNGKAGDKIDYISDIRDRLTSAFDMAGINFGEIDRCVLIGGSSQIPCVRAVLENIFSTNKVVVGNIGQGVARGASLIAAYELDRKAIEAGKEPKYMSKWDKIVLQENTAHNLGVKTTKGYSVIIKRNSATPTSRIKYFTPASLSANGELAIATIDVYQGGGQKWANVGSIKLPDIYTHGRKADQIIIKVEFIAKSTQILCTVTVEQGNADKSDIVVTDTLQLAGTSAS